MTALIEQLASDRLDRGTIVLAYALGIVVGTLVVAFLLVAVA
jgi:hypothetical protein